MLNIMLRVFENRDVRRVSGPSGEEVTNTQKFCK
jgi:hypothetical protein